MTPLSAQEFNQRRDNVAARLDRLGRTELTDKGANRTARKLVLACVVPGQIGDPRLPDEAMFRYQEWFQATAVGWFLVKYDYDYSDLTTGARRGYHLHPSPKSRFQVPHRVCVCPDGRGKGRHYEASRSICGKPTTSSSVSTRRDNPSTAPD